MKTIKLTQGKEAMVCDCHYDEVNQYKWCFSYADGREYAIRRIMGTMKNEYMHRFINKTPRGMFTDHEDGNGLNNQCNNLRNATPRQNSQNSKKRTDNTSGHKGVTWSKGDNRLSRWRARIVIDGKEVYLGRFLTLEEASKAYERAAKEHYNEFARIA